MFAGAFGLVVVVAVFFLLRYRRRHRKPGVLPHEILQVEFSPYDYDGDGADSSSHLTPFRVFESVITRQPLVDPPLSPFSTGKLSQRRTDSSSDRSPHESEPGLPSGPRLVVYDAEGVVVDSASLSDIVEEKRRLAVREQERKAEGHWPDAGQVAKLASRIRNSAGQLPPDYHLVTQPSTSKVP